MKAFKNLLHGAVLTMWAAAGVLVTLKALFMLSGLMPVLVFWGWFCAFAALTTFLATKLDTALGVLGLHGGLMLAMLLMPATLPFSVVRAGLDVVRSFS